MILLYKVFSDFLQLSVKTNLTNFHNVSIISGPLGCLGAVLWSSTSSSQTSPWTWTPWQFARPCLVWRTNRRGSALKFQKQWSLFLLEQDRGWWSVNINSGNISRSSLFSMFNIVISLLWSALLNKTAWSIFHH